MSFPIMGVSSNFSVILSGEELNLEKIFEPSYQLALPIPDDSAFKTNAVALSAIPTIDENIGTNIDLPSTKKKLNENEGVGLLVEGSKRKKHVSQKISVSAGDINDESSHEEIEPVRKKVRSSKAESNKKKNVIDFGDQTLSLGELLGQGAFGSVFEAQSRPVSVMDDQGTFAVKVNKKKTKAVQASIKNEASVLKRLSDMGADKWFIVSLLGQSEKGKSSYLIFPKYISNLRVESSRSAPNLERTALLADQLFSALYFLEEANPPIIHCDVKPDNIFVESIEPLKIRLGDFGASIDAPFENLNKKYLVTRWYRPPEVVFGFPLTNAVDMWSVGCVIYEYHTKRHLFRSESEPKLINDIYNLIGPFSKEYFDQIKIPSIAQRVERYSQLTQFSASGEQIPMLPGNLDRYVYFKRNSESTTAEQHEYEQSCVDLFKQMLSSIFCWDARSRLSAGVAKLHPFILKILKKDDLTDLANLVYNFDDEGL